MENRLARLAKDTGRIKTFYAKEAIIRYLDEMEDAYIALSRLEHKGKHLSMEEMEKQLGLEG